MPGPTIKWRLLLTTVIIILYISTRTGGNESPDMHNLIPSMGHQRCHEKFPNIKNVDYIEGTHTLTSLLHNGEGHISSWLVKQILLQIRGQLLLSSNNVTTTYCGFHWWILVWGDADVHNHTLRQWRDEQGQAYKVVNTDGLLKLSGDPHSLVTVSTSNNQRSHVLNRK